MLSFGHHTGSGVPLITVTSCSISPEENGTWKIKTFPDQYCWDLRKFLFLEKQAEPEKTEFL